MVKFGPNSLIGYKDTNLKKNVCLTLYDINLFDRYVWPIWKKNFIRKTIFIFDFTSVY